MPNLCFCWCPNFKPSILVDDGSTSLKLKYPKYPNWIISPSKAKTAKSLNPPPKTITHLKFNSSPLKSYSNPKMRSDRLAVPWFFQGAKRSTSGVYYLLAVSTMTWPPWTLNPGSLREFALFLHDPALDVREKMGCFRTSEGLQTFGCFEGMTSYGFTTIFLPNLPAKPRVHIPPLLLKQLVSRNRGFLSCWCLSNIVDLQGNVDSREGLQYKYKELNHLWLLDTLVLLREGWLSYLIAPLKIHSFPILSYCWWCRNPAPVDMVNIHKYHNIYRASCIPGG